MHEEDAEERLLRRPAAREHGVPLGVLRVGDEALVAVEPPAAVHLLGAGLEAGEIGAAARLGETEARQLVTGGDLRDDLLLQRLATEIQDGGERGPRGEEDARRAGARPRDLLDHQDLGEQINAAAAELRRVGQAEELELAEGRHGADGKLGALVHLEGVRTDLGVDHATDVVAEREVDVVVGVAHVMAGYDIPPERSIADGDGRWTAAPAISE